MPVQIRARIGITTLPASIGKIPNLTKIYLRDCVNLRSLPEELAHFPLKFIQLHNSAHLIDNETYLPEKIVKFVLIEWYHGDFNFNNFSSRKKNLDFDQIIDNLSLVYESLESNVLSVLISCFREKKIQIIRILEQWIEKSSNITTKKLFLNFVIKISLKIENPNGLLFL